MEEKKDCPTISINKAGAIIALILGVMAILTPVFALYNKTTFTEKQTLENTEDIQFLETKYNGVDKKLDTMINTLQMIVDGKITLTLQK